MKNNKSKKMFKNTIYRITKYIKSSPTLFDSFYRKTKNRKFKVEKLLSCILKLVKNGMTFRESHNCIEYQNISWTTIYKFYVKLIKFNIIQKTYNKTIKHFLNKTKQNIFLTDTTLIANKMGIDNIGYNPQLIKHKSLKISIITTVDGVPIDTYITSGNCNDSKILFDQINSRYSNFHKITTKNNELLADSGYDSNKIRDKLKELEFGQLLCHRNKRNTKNLEKLKTIKLNDTTKIKLKKRFKVEHIFSHLKSFRRISYRYDKFSQNYNNFVLLAILMITLKITSKDKLY